MASTLNETASKVTISGVQFWIGQRWKEKDKRFDRIVEVVGWDIPRGRVKIKYVRTTWALAYRFGSGRSNGYSLIGERA